MTVRTLVVVIDDELPLGPQLAGARLRAVPWKLLRELSGGLSVRHLQNLAASAHFCERQAVQWNVTLPGTPSDRTPEEGAM